MARNQLICRKCRNIQATTRTLSTAGVSIIEILISTVVVATVLTAIASGLTFSLKNNAIAKYRQLASNLAQEGIEVFRRERQSLGWTRFKEFLIANNTYCLNQLPDTSVAFLALQPGDCSSEFSLSGEGFTREVLTNPIDAGTIRVEVQVSWVDGTTPKTTSVVQEFKEI